MMNRTRLCVCDSIDNLFSLLCVAAVGDLRSEWEREKAMGNCCQGPSSEYTIYVRTGDRGNAGTDANIRIILHDDHGHRTEEINLDNFLRNDFERGALDQFTVPKNKLKGVERLGHIAKIEFWRDDAGLASDWYVDKVVVENKQTNAMFVFPVFRWVRPDWHYFIKHMDTSLPQFEEFREQRQKELEEKRKTYVFAQKAVGMPAQVSKRCRVGGGGGRGGGGGGGNERFPG